MVLSLMPSSHPFFILFLPKINPPVIKDATVIIANNIFNMVGENRPKYCNKVTINEDVKKTIKLTNVQIDIFFR